MSTESQLLQAILTETRRLADAQEKATRILEQLTGGAIAAPPAPEPAPAKPKRKAKR